MKTNWLSFIKIFVIILCLSGSNAFAAIPDGDSPDKKQTEEPVNRMHGFSFRLPVPDSFAEFSYLRFEVRLFMEKDEQITELPDDLKLDYLRFDIRNYMPLEGEEIQELPDEE